MATDDKDTRRIRVRNTFEDYDFKFVNPNKKADKFQIKTDFPVYFYWNQGKELNLSIDPRINFSTLLTLDGVCIPKGLIDRNGLRAGTTMKGFPSSFEALTPVDPESRVGRMFEVQEVTLPSFLRALISLINSTERHFHVKGIPANKNVTITSTQDDETDPSERISDLDTSASTSQGYESDPVLRRVIEQYAVARAINHYSKVGY
jgi:hypothetical protein